MSEREDIAAWLRTWGAGWPNSGNADFDAGFDQAIRSAAECIRDEGEDPQGLRAEHESPVPATPGCAQTIGQPIHPSNPSEQG